MSQARLQQLLALAHQQDSALAAWLGAGLRRYDCGESLEAALDLTGPGARRLRNSILRRLGKWLIRTATFPHGKPRGALRPF